MLTYETLFELSRREKSREELQKIESAFYKDVAVYLKEKASLPTQNNVFAEDDQTKSKIQLANIKLLLKELYERRERKIIQMALVKSRTKSSIIDTSALLEEEKSLFEELLLVLSRNQESVLQSLLTKHEIRRGFEDVAITFLSEIPKFVGRNLELYGPFVPGDTATIPKELASIIIAKGKAKETKEEKPGQIT